MIHRQNLDSNRNYGTSSSLFISLNDQFRIVVATYVFFFQFVKIVYKHITRDITANKSNTFKNSNEIYN